MRADGFTFLFISHKLDEVRAIADSITVIRRGTPRRHGRPEHRDQPPAGRDDGRQRAAQPGDPRVHGHRPGGAAASGLELAGESGARPVLAGIDLVVHAGEVLGIAGVEGNGQTELVETIMGMRRASAGTSCWAARTSPRPAPSCGARPASATCPRTAPGTDCCSTQSLWANRMLGYQSRPPVSRGGLLGLIDRAAARRTPSGSSPSSTSARRASTCRRPRCPVATSRSWWSAASCPVTRCC